MVKKTILRALRGEYKNSYNQYLNDNGLQEENDVQQFEENLEAFSDYIKSRHPHQDIETKYGEMDNMPFIIGCFINFCKTKKFKKTPMQDQLIEEFNGVLYKYSHRKFRRFLEHSEVRFLFDNVIFSSNINSFIDNSETLRKNKLKYKPCIKELINDLAMLSMKFQETGVAAFSEKSEGSDSK